MDVPELLQWPILSLTMTGCSPDCHHKKKRIFATKHNRVFRVTDMNVEDHILLQVQIESRLLYFKFIKSVLHENYPPIDNYFEIPNY